MLGRVTKIKMIKIKEFISNVDKYIKPNKKPYIIAVCGGSASGKSLISQKIVKTFSSLVIKMDDYYIRGICKNNKDIPRALNLVLLRKNLEELKKGKSIEKPVYTFGLKKDYTETVKPKPVIILDGLFALNKKFLPLEDLKIFVHASEKVRLERRIKRDVEERGYTKEHVIERWNSTVEPMYKKYVLPQEKKADLIINSDEDIS